jgi:capsular polysaccharide biosynthesis protein
MKLRAMLLRVKIALITALIQRNVIGIAFFNLCRLMSNSRIDIRALRLVWMDETVAHENGLLRRGVEGTTYAPHYLGGVQTTESVYLPEIRYFMFERARVSATSSSVILNDEQVIIDGVMGPDQKSYNFAAGHILMHGENTAVVRLRKPGKIQRGIFLGGNGSFNYYHWMVEILTKLEFLTKLPEHYQKYPLLVSEDAVGIPSFKEALDLLGGGREIVVLKRESSYVVDELVYVNSPNNLPFNLFGNQKYSCSYVAIDSGSIDYIRKMALENSQATATHQSYPRKIFLCRRTERRNYNQNEVFTYLSKFGFVKVFMEDLSFFEQARTAHYADYIVGPTGAAWTNLIFCRSSAKMLCWMAEEYGDFSAYSSIAGIIGADLRYFTYKAGVHSAGELYSKEYFVDLSMVERGLSTLTDVTSGSDE